VATAVVCDDDEGLRAVISGLCEDAGIEVVAETDSAGDAAELVRRFGIDLLVLDLSLKESSGTNTLHYLHDAGLRPTIVVFTAYADDPGALMALGATAVVEKPDLDHLAAVLSSVAEGDVRAAPGEERRLASRAVDAAPSLWRSPAGVSAVQDLEHSLATLEVGDAVLGIDVVALDALEGDVGPVLVADCRLAVARLLRATLRVQDLLHEAPDHAGFLALLRGGDARSADAVWARLAKDVREAELPGRLHGVGGRVDALGAADAVARVSGALRGVTISSPPFLSV
jgi:CheY-like chemotaxis protein